MQKSKLKQTKQNLDILCKFQTWVLHCLSRGWGWAQCMGLFYQAQHPFVIEHIKFSWILNFFKRWKYPKIETPK